MTTLLEALRATMAALDDGGVYLVASSTSTDVTVGGLTNSTSNASAGRYNGANIAVVSGNGTGQQRTVKGNSYVPATGVVVISTGWNTTPSSNDLVAITRLFPVFESGSGVTGVGETVSYRQLINRALQKLRVPDRISLTITTADSYSLGSVWPWLDREERLNREAEGGWLKEPSPVSGRRPVSAMWRGPRAVFDASTPALELHAPFGATGGSMTIEVLRPANTWIATSGTYAETNPAGGLVNASDETLAKVEDIVTAFMREACLSLMSRNNGQPNGEWAKKFAFWDGEVRKLRYYDASLLAPAAPVEAAA